MSEQKSRDEFLEWLDNEAKESEHSAIDHLNKEDYQTQMYFLGRTSFVVEIKEKYLETHPKPDLERIRKVIEGALQPYAVIGFDKEGYELEGTVDKRIIARAITEALEKGGLG